MKESVVWRGGRAESVYDAFRIPGIIVTNKGTLIIYGEARDYQNILGIHCDWAAIDIVMKRSTDGGETWSDTKILCGGANAASPEGLRTTNNPVMIADGNTIHMVYCTWCALERTGGGVFYIKSEDDGITWSEPKNISKECYTDEYNRCLCVTGPGHGVVMSGKSRNPGMLLVPVWMTPVKDGNDMEHFPNVVSTLYSLDKGDTWQLGKVIYSTDKVIDPNESAAVELSDGGVMLNMRNEGSAGWRAVTVSGTGYDNWSAPYFDETLIDPVCFGSIVRYDINTLLFVNCASESSRTNLTVRVSRDDGKTWEASRSIAQNAGYSDIAVGEDGMIYVLYEINAGEISMNLLRFDLDWIYNNIK